MIGVHHRGAAAVRRRDRHSAVTAMTGAAAVPRKNGELVFDAPWQSRAFGMVVGLVQKGLFTGTNSATA